MKMDYNSTREAMRRGRDQLVLVSPFWKLTLVRPAEKSVATPVRSEHEQECCAFRAPLVAFSLIVSLSTERGEEPR